MPNIMIRDLEVSKEIDREAMANIMGGTIISTWTKENKTTETYLGTRVGDDGWLYSQYSVRYQRVTFEDGLEIQERRAKLC